MKDKKAPLAGGVHAKLTTTEQEILHLLSVEHLTRARIAKRRKTTVSAVSKMISRLYKKGALRRAVPPATFGGIGSDIGRDSVPVVKRWDLHGCKWRVKILHGHRDELYAGVLGKGTAKVTVRKATCQLYRDKILIHAKGLNFLSSHPDKAVRQSWDYLWSVLAVLENDYGLLLMKDRVPIRRYAGHFARMNDEAAQRVPGGETVTVYDDDDGKLRFWIDWSKTTFPEAEFGHAHHAEDDARYYERHVNDLLKMRPPELSAVFKLQVETAQQIKTCVELVKNNSQSIQNIAQLISPSKPGTDEDNNLEADYFG